MRQRFLSHKIGRTALYPNAKPLPFQKTLLRKRKGKLFIQKRIIIIIIIANHVSAQGLVTRMYDEGRRLSGKTVESVREIHTPRRCRDGGERARRRPTSPVIETTARPRSVPLGGAQRERPTVPSAGEDVEPANSTGTPKGSATLENGLLNLNAFPLRPSNPVPRHVHKINKNVRTHRDCLQMFPQLYSEQSETE